MMYHDWTSNNRIVRSWFYYIVWTEENLKEIHKSLYALAASKLGVWGAAPAEVWGQSPHKAKERHEKLYL